MDEIIFEVREDEVDGGFVATALGHAIATEGETLEELREMARDAVRCHFGDGVPGPMPKIIRLHFVRDEALTVRRSPGTSTRPNWSAPSAYSVMCRFDRTAPISG